MPKPFPSCRLHVNRFSARTNLVIRKLDQRLVHKTFLAKQDAIKGPAKNVLSHQLSHPHNGLWDEHSADTPQPHTELTAGIQLNL
jgi:hypothetical protein